MVLVDQDKCIGCGTCVQDCVSRALILRSGQAEIQSNCIQCGHCVAICPEGCVSIPEYDMADVEEYDPESFRLDSERFLHAVKFRRSIRSYQPRSVDRKTLEFILQAGRYTATAVNRQDCSFIIIQNQLPEFKKVLWDAIEETLSHPTEELPEGIEVFRTFCERRKKNPQEDYLFRNAPAVLLIAANNLWDAGMAAQNMEMAAVSKGLGALYDGYLLRAAKLPAPSEWLGIGEKPLATAMLLGYSAVQYERTAPRRAVDVIWK